MLEKCLWDTIRNLEILSGRKLEDPKNPLLIAMRSAMPEYLPGFMPTYLNVGLTPEMFPGLPERYGGEAAIRIRLSNRKTILEALDPEAFRDIEKKIDPGRTKEENLNLISVIEALIEKLDPGLLTSAFQQVQFFLGQALSGNIDPQTFELLDLLAQPYRKFSDFDDPRTLARLKKICDAEGIPVPWPEDI
jgi:hypothetical protein